MRIEIWHKSGVGSNDAMLTRFEVNPMERLGVIEKLLDGKGLGLTFSTEGRFVFIPWRRIVQVEVVD